MQKFFSRFVPAFFSFLVLLPSGAQAFAEPGLNLPVYSTSYDDQRDPFADARAAIKLAKSTQRNVLLEIGGNWCTWCKKMDAFLEQNPEVYRQLHDKFVLLKINVSDSNENEAFMSALPPVLGYPHMYVSTASGKMILSKDTAELLQDGKYSVKHWLEFINTWQANGKQG
ncbi:thioredoxin family protein [Thalassomonas actiniarum]|uniref:Thioredoxin family protein n=1 Tax=Thalassomonas actiniarum TaxID=485447 RepID=A0AAE9YR67_9GAMM|nr:thioredoxin family protein [Thalassomonas actiniarum]WDD98908.1 thioredoxin family protein [Thalassomonas actiniarum]